MACTPRASTRANSTLAEASTLQAMMRTLAIISRAFSVPSQWPRPVGAPGEGRDELSNAVQPW